MPKKITTVDGNDLITQRLQARSERRGAIIARTYGKEKPFSHDELMTAGRRKSRSGFSFIELMVAVAVVAIMSFIVIPSVDAAFTGAHADVKQEAPGVRAEVNLMNTEPVFQQAQPIVMPESADTTNAAPTTEGQ